MKPSEFKFPFQSKVMMKKQLKITEIATLPKNLYFQNYQRYRSQILISQIKDLNKDWGKISFYLIFHTFREISRQIALGSGRVRSSRTGWITVLNDSASPKMVMKIYLYFFRFFSKVLELFECQRGDPIYNCLYELRSLRSFVIIN